MTDPNSNADAVHDDPPTDPRKDDTSLALAPEIWKYGGEGEGEGDGEGDGEGEAEREPDRAAQTEGEGEYYPSTMTPNTNDPMGSRDNPVALPPDSVVVVHNPDGSQSWAAAPGYAGLQVYQIPVGQNLPYDGKWGIQGVPVS